MVGAPERIWAFQSDGGQRGWLHTQPPQAIIDIPVEYVRADLLDTLTEERDRLKQWQADQVEAIDEAKALITELNADKKALEAERDRLVKERQALMADFLAQAESRRIAEAERDRLALANAELLAGLTSVLQACDGGRMVARGVGGMTIDAQIRRSVINGVPAWPIEEARALLDKHKATSTEGE